VSKAQKHDQGEAKKPPSHLLPRTSTLDPERADRILWRLADGESLNRAAVIEGTDRRRFLEWCDKDEELADKYARARRFCSEAGRDKIIELREKLEAGAIDAATFRALNDSIKWEMCKLHPRIYGEKLEIEHGGGVEIDATKMLGELGSLLEAAMNASASK